MPDILIYRRTLPAKEIFPLYPQNRSHYEECSNSEKLIGPLLALGDAEYSLDQDHSFYQAPAFALPFDYRFVDKSPRDAVNPFRIVSFSRVALNRLHSEGVFYVFSSGCRYAEVGSKRVLECGGGTGGFLHADRTEQHTWHFRPVKNCPITVE